jgi:hypothetical protein
MHIYGELVTSRQIAAIRRDHVLSIIVQPYP